MTIRDAPRPIGRGETIPDTSGSRTEVGAPVNPSRIGLKPGLKSSAPDTDVPRCLFHGADEIILEPVEPNSPKDCVVARIQGRILVRRRERASIRMLCTLVAPRMRGVRTSTAYIRAASRLLHLFVLAERLPTALQTSPKPDCRPVSQPEARAGTDARSRPRNPRRLRCVGETRLGGESRPEEGSLA
jgi:hypothetical protein